MTNHQHHWPVGVHIAVVEGAPRTLHRLRVISIFSIKLRQIIEIVQSVSYWQTPKS